MASEPETWTIDQVADHLGASSASSARKTLSRWEVAAVGYERGPNGRPQALFDADEVRRAKLERPGRGTRTDRRARVQEAP